MMKNVAAFFAVFALLLQALIAPQALAQRDQIQLLRDAETERFIRDLSQPIFMAAGLDSGFVNVHLVNDRSLNAFVAGGQRVFVNTGLLMRVRNANELAGVMAHEAGHIAAGHLARMREAIREATAIAIITTLLGAAAMVAGATTGDGSGGQAGAGIMMGGQSMAMRNFLNYTRTQESAADQAALTFLEQSKMSPRGLVSFLEVLGAQEALLSARQDPYVRTHPVSADRIAALQSRLAQSPFRDAQDPPDMRARLERIQAKLFGFVENFQTVMNRYPPQDQSPNARYARAHAFYRTSDAPRALAEMEALLAQSPNDPYFLEFKAQILYEFGRAPESIEPYRRAASLLPDEPLLQAALAQAMVASQDDRYLDEAIGILRNALRLDRDNAGAWQQLAVAYGRKNDIGMASLATAERFMVLNATRDAKFHAERAARLLPAGSPSALRAQDILNAIESANR